MGQKTWRTEQPTEKAILGVVYRVILLTGLIGIQRALPKSCQESCFYHINHSWNMLKRFLCNVSMWNSMWSPKTVSEIMYLPHKSQLKCVDQR